MRTRFKVLLIALFLILGFAGGICLAIVSADKVDSYLSGRKLSLGDRYLNEQEYEKAILAYQSAIEIDPRQVEAYIGMADAYKGMKNPEMAAELLKLGWEAVPDERLKTRIIRVYTDLYKQYMDEGEYEKAHDILTDAYEMTRDSEIRKLLDELETRQEQSQAQQELLEQLLKAAEASDTLKLVTLLRTTEYSEFIAGIDRVFYYPQKNGEAIAIYDNGCLYYGGLSEGSREGRAIWIKASSGKANIYEGLWQKDKPEGQGMVSHCTYTAGGTLSTVSTTSGTFRAGLENGNMTMLVYDQGRTYTYYYRAITGILQPMENSARYVDTDGSYIVAVSIEDSTMQCIDQGDLIYGVYGFASGDIQSQIQ
ncbi:tetratricopeptide repeat protein [Lacrimispora sp. BS-2]|uniref:Tetratricopeptide repeat protein n=1 Tax=Lacrimispora sp. BS-2 TaxID=3151850 RepID=A0AAU7PJU1_9FIRM